MPLLVSRNRRYNAKMLPRLTDEMRTALHAQDGAPVEIQDEETQKRYLLIERDIGPRLIEAWFKAFVQQGLDDAAAGRVSAWDINEMRRICRQRTGKGLDD